MKLALSKTPKTDFLATRPIRFKQYLIEIFAYGKCSKISNTFLFLFSTKMLVIRTEAHKMLVKIANREEDPGKQSDLGMVFLPGN